MYPGGFLSEDRTLLSLQIWWQSTNRSKRLSYRAVDLLSEKEIIPMLPHLPTQFYSHLKMPHFFSGHTCLLPSIRRRVEAILPSFSPDGHYNEENPRRYSHCHNWRHVGTIAIRCQAHRIVPFIHDKHVTFFFLTTCQGCIAVPIHTHCVMFDSACKQKGGLRQDWGFEITGQKSFSWRVSVKHTWISWGPASTKWGKPILRSLCMRQHDIQFGREPQLLVDVYFDALDDEDIQETNIIWKTDTMKAVSNVAVEKTN